MKMLMDLFFTFVKIGLFTFGGGYAMISMIQNNCVEKKKWISYEDMMNVTVIAESTPGPIAINCATFVGYQQAGFWGSLIATFGIVLPSFLVIFTISMFLDNFLEISIIAHAFKGIKVAIGIVILDAAITMIKKMHKKLFPQIIMLCSFAVMLLINIFAWNFSTISLMLIVAAISFIIFIISGNRKQKGGADK